MSDTDGPTDPLSEAVRAYYGDMFRTLSRDLDVLGQRAAPIVEALFSDLGRLLDRVVTPLAAPDGEGGQTPSA